MLIIDKLNLFLGHKHILKNISLKLPIKGEIIGIMGPNGSGKSSLIKSIVGEHPTNGTLTLNDQPIHHVLTDITYIPQKSTLDLDFPINVEDLVLSGSYQDTGWFKPISKSVKTQRNQLLKELKLYDLRKRQLNTLSGGQLQRVFIARALMSDSQVYLLDEPFVGIDFTSEQIIFQKLQELKNSGKLILIVHHDLSTARDYFSRIILLNQSIMFFGDANEALQPEHIEHVFLNRLADNSNTTHGRKEHQHHVVHSTST
ncbi:metal ABC transporter ATP-binding protein [Staphylococcus canis]|uniref:Metal ABC transporter ATP-binding protein n=1 Tax=Staphylococcus canis TaxID=2724942 RepID=A0ABS0T8S0_9STAP|nr:metal ABC transporter ATP-binding protein [Staphylococcus canis]MBI5975135.1 metal ABC transporter ATP-binding protein [Staphylococcus canis]